MPGAEPSPTVPGSAPPGMFLPHGSTHRHSLASQHHGSAPGQVLEKSELMFSASFISMDYPQEDGKGKVKDPTNRIANLPSSVISPYKRSCLWKTNNAENILGGICYFIFTNIALRDYSNTVCKVLDILGIH